MGTYPKVTLPFSIKLATWSNLIGVGVELSLSMEVIISQSLPIPILSQIKIKYLKMSQSCCVGGQFQILLEGGILKLSMGSILPLGSLPYLFLFFLKKRQETGQKCSNDLSCTVVTLLTAFSILQKFWSQNLVPQFFHNCALTPFYKINTTGQKKLCLPRFFCGTMIREYSFTLDLKNYP